MLVLLTMIIIVRLLLAHVLLVALVVVVLLAHWRRHLSHVVVVLALAHLALHAIVLRTALGHGKLLVGVLVGLMLLEWNILLLLLHAHVHLLLLHLLSGRLNLLLCLSPGGLSRSTTRCPHTFDVNLTSLCALVSANEPVINAAGDTES